jgi:hypothetical protein
MPVRIERWNVGGATLYKVIGIQWGGAAASSALAIRFNPGDQLLPVDACPAPTTSATWSLWSYAWAPSAPGSYRIELAVTDPTVQTRRLDRGYYARTVEISAT